MSAIDDLCYCFCRLKELRILHLCYVVGKVLDSCPVLASRRNDSECVVLCTHANRHCATQTHVGVYAPVIAVWANHLPLFVYMYQMDMIVVYFHAKSSKVAQIGLKAAQKA